MGTPGTCPPAQLPALPAPPARTRCRPVPQKVLRGIRWSRGQGRVGKDQLRPTATDCLSQSPLAASSSARSPKLPARGGVGACAHVCHTHINIRACHLPTPSAFHLPGPSPARRESGVMQGKEICWQSLESRAQGGSGEHRGWGRGQSWLSGFAHPCFLSEGEEVKV